MGDDSQGIPRRLPPEPRTPDEACSALGRIRFGRGIHDDKAKAELAKTSVDFQQMTEEDAQERQREAGAMFKTVADQLYTSPFRFIYELIQNADDVPYSNCIKKGVPYIKFTIRPTEITIDSNEDGFTVENVFSICTINQSSKKGDQATTGEKGLGFKSVFTVSKLVHIQSGVWSFEFQNPPEDNGLGMGTPYWVEPKTLNDNVTTRITLIMKSTELDFRQRLRKAFEDVPDTTLLFLRRLTKLVISFESDGAVHSFTRGNDWNDGEKSIAVDLKGVKEDVLYKMRSETVAVPPKRQSVGSNSIALQPTKVELAFPVGKYSQQPRADVRGQHIFTFLPMKRIPQIPFIIQADFDTTANREEVTDSPRNRQLRDAVAELFVAAVGDFCKNDRGLRYTWTQYLPADQLDDFWTPLRREIRRRLPDKPLLEARGTSKLHPISELRVVPSVFLHQGNPLFESDIYLSSEYDKSAISALKTLDLPTLNKSEMLDYVERDLNLLGTPNSIIGSTELSDGWHTTFVEFLLNSICPDNSVNERLERLAVLPVSCVDRVLWTKPATISQGQQIYLPWIDADDKAPIIDPEINVDTIHPEACEVAERRGFYAHWGITYIEPDFVIAKVIVTNSARETPNSIQYVKHFATLFWHAADIRLEWAAADNRELPLPPENLYLRSDEEYSTDQLLYSTIDHFNFGFLHQDYFDSEYAKRYVTNHVNREGQKWRDWLIKVAKVRDYPELKSPGFDGISPVFQEIINNAPSMVVGTLKEHWENYKGDVPETSRILDELKNALVQCRTGGKHKLSETILPTETLLSDSKSFGLQHRMRFLQIGSDDGSVNEEDWSSLNLFGVCLKPSLKFSLVALKHLASLPASAEEAKSHAIAVYKSIVSLATQNDKESLKEFFTTRSAIHASCQWLKMNDCVWEGPDNFKIAKTILAQEYESQESAKVLFTNLLGVDNATHEDILQAIENSRTCGSNLELMTKMYKWLDDELDWSKFGAEIRTKFEEKELICADQKWMKLSSCVWNSAVTLRGKAIVNKIYPDLRGFFVNRLGVKSMNMAMMLEELIDVVDKGVTKPEDVKTMLREIASMLSTEELTDEADGLIKRLKQIKFLPVKGCGSAGTTSLVSPKDTFLIVDDRQLGNASSGKIRLLDFAFNELTSMQPLFAVLRLEHLYISRHVRIETTVTDSTVDGTLTDDMKRRSFAISCCALSYKSAYAQKEYTRRHQQLMACEICTSATMYTTFKVEQDKNLVPVATDRSFLKISEEDGKLKIFVPKDDVQRQRCYRAHLPRQLMRFLDIVAQPAEKQLYRILNDRPSTLDEVLSEEGIPEVQGLERLPSLDEDNSDQASDELVIEEAITVSVQQSHLRPGSGVRNGIHVAPRPMDDDVDSGFEDQVPGPHSPVGYRKVLEHVVRRAQAADGSGAFDLSDLYEALIPRARGDLGIVPGQPITEDVKKRIGAAGELFVLERLRARGLTALSRANWQSNIRHLVRDLPQYRDMEPWRPHEKADIMYDDVDGGMEAFFRQESFNPFPTWDGEEDSAQPIKFMVEVKTSMNDCNDQFFMTTHQYELMSANALVGAQRPTAVYVVARVHHLLSADIAVTYFVNPKSLDGTTLRFEPKDYTVTPRV